MQRGSAQKSTGSSTNIVRRDSRLNWFSSQRAPRRGTCGIWNSNESNGASRHRCRELDFLEADRDLVEKLASGESLPECPSRWIAPG